MALFNEERRGDVVQGRDSHLGKRKKKRKARERRNFQGRGSIIGRMVTENSGL